MVLIWIIIHRLSQLITGQLNNVKPEETLFRSVDIHAHFCLGVIRCEWAARRCSLVCIISAYHNLIILLHSRAGGLHYSSLPSQANANESAYLGWFGVTSIQLSGRFVSLFWDSVCCFGQQQAFWQLWPVILGFDRIRIWKWFCLFLKSARRK